jgi:hypothetical protein
MEYAPLVVTESAAARMLAVSIAALRRWRREQRGPRFVRLGRCIRYPIQDLKIFLNENGEPVSFETRDPSSILPGNRHHQVSPRECSPGVDK